MESLLYISQSCIPPSDAAAVIGSIVATSVEQNSARGLTGALLFTGTHFAQVLEGETAFVDELMAKVLDDPRHNNLLVVTRECVAKRRFSDLSMAYFGPSQFVSRHVKRLLNDPSPVEKRRGAEWLTELLREFSSAKCR